MNKVIDFVQKKYDRQVYEEKLINDIGIEESKAFTRNTIKLTICAIGIIVYLTFILWIGMVGIPALMHSFYGV
jgi:hypothetical protein